MIVTSRRLILARSVSLCVLVCVLLAPLPSAAQGPTRNPARPQRENIVLPVFDATQALPARVPARTYAALQSQAFAAQPTTIIIELRESAAATIAPANASVSRAQMIRVESAQQAAEAALRTAGIPYRVVFAPQRVFSGLIIEAAPNQLDAIRQLPGVVDAYPAGVGVVANDGSVPFLGAPVVWTSGYRGQNVRVGVIDTGIDYAHADFGGTGPGTIFPTLKVAGGYDFVGDTWHPDTNPGLLPDADPMDQQGHGTHMAGTIAGYGVDGTGNTYSGPWDITTPFATMIIGPGMAPQATLYALKVGANHGFVSEAGTIAALEWAVDPNGDGDLSDRLDVVNMSIGTSFGDLNRGWTVAADNAAQAGVIVVAAAVNIEDYYFSQGDPATAPRVISVGQSNDDANGGPAADTMGTYSARGPQRNPDPASIALKPDIVAPGIDIYSADAGTVNGGVSTGALGGTSAASSHVSGMMVLLREAYPGWTVAQLKALVMNTATHDLFTGNNFTPPIYGPARVGAGRMDAVNAFASAVIAYNTVNPAQVSASFGLLNVASATT
ncbi:MAG: S8 family serine peptidase, partial [Anaerolineae bacterium]|nr:S8 family serine peptidase [Anaerolineae bacterium]